MVFDITIELTTNNDKCNIGARCSDGDTAGWAGSNWEGMVWLGSDAFPAWTQRNTFSSQHPQTAQMQKLLPTPPPMLHLSILQLCFCPRPRTRTQQHSSRSTHLGSVNPCHRQECTQQLIASFSGSTSSQCIWHFPAQYKDRMTAMCMWLRRRCGSGVWLRHLDDIVPNHSILDDEWGSYPMRQQLLPSKPMQMYVWLSTMPREGVALGLVLVRPRWSQARRWFCYGCSRWGDWYVEE